MQHIQLVLQYLHVVAKFAIMMSVEGTSKLQRSAKVYIVPSKGGNICTETCCGLGSKLQATHFWFLHNVKEYILIISRVVVAVLISINEVHLLHLCTHILA